MAFSWKEIHGGRSSNPLTFTHAAFSVPTRRTSISVKRAKLTRSRTKADEIVNSPNMNKISAKQAFRTANE
jgi:hypothetical protein